MNLNSFDKTFGVESFEKDSKINQPKTKKFKIKKIKDKIENLFKAYSDKIYFSNRLSECLNQKKEYDEIKSSKYFIFKVFLGCISKGSIIQTLFSTMVLTAFNLLLFAISLLLEKWALMIVDFLNNFEKGFNVLVLVTALWILSYLITGCMNVFSFKEKYKEVNNNVEKYKQYVENNHLDIFESMNDLAKKMDTDVNEKAILKRFYETSDNELNEKIYKIIDKNLKGINMVSSSKDLGISFKSLDDDIVSKIFSHLKSTHEDAKNNNLAMVANK